MYCSNCGKQIESNAKYCYSCGSKVTQMPDDVKEVEDRENELVNENQEESSKSISKSDFKVIDKDLSEEESNGNEVSKDDDSINTLDERAEDTIEYEDASKTRRFVNLFIDIITVNVIIFFTVILFNLFFGGFGGSDDFSGLIIQIIIYFLYYFIMESLFRKTVGKMFTKTKVIHDDGGQLSATTVLGRTLCRFVPFEALTFLGGRGFHDYASKTRVVINK